MLHPLKYNLIVVTFQPLKDSWQHFLWFFAIEYIIFEDKKFEVCFQIVFKFC
jgi:hypothetical protein